MNLLETFDKLNNINEDYVAPASIYTYFHEKYDNDINDLDSTLGGKLFTDDGVFKRRGVYGIMCAYDKTLPIIKKLKSLWAAIYANQPWKEFEAVYNSGINPYRNDQSEQDAAESDDHESTTNSELEIRQGKFEIEEPKKSQWIIDGQTLANKIINILPKIKAELKKGWGLDAYKDFLTCKQIEPDFDLDLELLVDFNDDQYFEDNILYGIDSKSRSARSLKISFSEEILRQHGIKLDPIEVSMMYYQDVTEDSKIKKYWVLSKEAHALIKDPNSKFVKDLKLKLIKQLQRIIPKFSKTKKRADRRIPENEFTQETLEQLLKNNEFLKKDDWDLNSNWNDSFIADCIRLALKFIPTDHTDYHAVLSAIREIIRELEKPDVEDKTKAHLTVDQWKAYLELLITRNIQSIQEEDIWNWELIKKMRPWIIQLVNLDLQAKGRGINSEQWRHLNDRF